MTNEVTSKHLIGSTELTVLMPIRQEFVDARDTITYATRLRFMLRILNGIRKASRESVIAREYVGPIERLQTISDVRFAILENDTKLLLSVSFDRPWEPYIRAIRNDAGPLLDAICSHCEDYTGKYHTDLGFEEFAQWVRKYQVDVDFYYNAQPALTTDDYRYLKQLESLQRASRDVREFDRAAARMSLRSPLEEAEEKAAESLYAPDVDMNEDKKKRKKRLIRQGLRAVKAMYALDSFYPDPSKLDIGDAQESKQDLQRKSAQELERKFWIRAAQSVLKQFDSRKLVPSGKPLRDQYRKELEWFEYDAEPKPVDADDPRGPMDFDRIQGGILNSYPGINYGVLVLIKFSDAQSGRDFLETIYSNITVESAEKKDAAMPLNIALTSHGLQTLGLRDGVYEHFPKEFREGMEARAGMLGDIRENHPFHWKLPAWNWPLGRLKNHKKDANIVCKVPLASVDAVVQILGRVEVPDGQVGENPSGDDYEFNDFEKLYEFGADHPLIEEVKKLQREGTRILSVQPLRRKYKQDRVAVDEDKPNKKTNRYAEEHFGFADGISQPCATPDPNHHDDVSYGEILHGYVNDKDNVKGEEKSDNEIPPQQKIANDLFKNSSFLVIRKLRQRVEEFEKVIREQSDNIGIREEVLKGKLMGRSTDGRPLVESSHIQDFDFDNDAEGKECPFQAHIRRSNPRAPARRKVPRIMRRGFAYGPRFSTKGNDAVDRGLMFMSYSASIAEQFEVIQRWISGGNSTGILSGQDDPLLGVPPAKDSPRSFRFTHGNRAARCDLGSTPFVELQWGMYLFAPSLSAIDQLIKDPGKEAVTDKGLRIIEKLKDLEKFEKQKEEPDDQKIEDTWKKVLEDRSARLGGITEAVWAAIRKHPDGTLNTPYGLLVGSAERVKTIFATPDPYSVREFWFRMRKTLGEGFLGMDPEPQKIAHPPSDSDAGAKDEEYRAAVKKDDYKKQACPVNAEVFAVKEDQSYVVARDSMKDMIDLKTNDDLEGILDLRYISGFVMMKLCNYYFGIPIRPDPDMIKNYVFAARFIFSAPRPSEFLSKKASVRGKIELKKAREFVEFYRPKPDELDDAEIAKALFQKTDLFEENEEGNELLAKTLAGLSNGLIAPTIGSFLSMMNEMIGSGKLWRVQQQYLSDIKVNDREDFGKVEKLLVPVVLAAMCEKPVPDVVHRTNTADVPYKDCKIIRTKDDDGKDTDERELAPESVKRQLPPGSTVVLGIESATHDDDKFKNPRTIKDADVIFGGDYERDGSPGTHSCPGARMGIGILTGMLAALLESGNLKLENAPITLSRNMEDERAVD